MKLSLALAASAAALLVAGSAGAVITVSTSSVAGLNDVHSAGTQTGTTVFATLVAGNDFYFSSADGLTTNGSGVAQVNNDGVPAGVGFTNVTFGTVGGGDFTAINFALVPYNLQGPVLPVYVDFYTSLNGGAFALASNGNDVLLTTGENKFSVSGGTFDAVRLQFYSSTPGTGTPNIGIDSVRQVSVSALTAGVPEPATWGLMILGMGGVGAMMRTRRRQAVLTA
jgi:hypothetical protein